VIDIPGNRGKETKNLHLLYMLLLLLLRGGRKRGGPSTAAAAAAATAGNRDRAGMAIDPYPHYQVSHLIRRKHPKKYIAPRPPFLPPSLPFLSPFRSRRWFRQHSRHCQRFLPQPPFLCFLVCYQCHNLT